MNGGLPFSLIWQTAGRAFAAMFGGVFSPARRAAILCGATRKKCAPKKLIRRAGKTPAFAPPVFIAKNRAKKRGGVLQKRKNFFPRQTKRGKQTPNMW
ncbi:MAG: hypothetical protein ACR2P5_00985 [Gammaproteobacteria bacterium]